MNSRVLSNEIKRFWNPDGNLHDGRPAYVKVFRSAVDSEKCVLALISSNLIPGVRHEQEKTTHGFFAVRLDKELLDELSEPHFK